MKRPQLTLSFASVCALGALLGLPAAASARRTAAAKSSHRIVASGSVYGTVTAINGSTFTVQTPGKWGGVVDALTSAATKITREDYPYVYGGGHAHASVASVGIPGPGYNGHRKGFDCSGSVAAVLTAGGLWQPRSGVPNDLWMTKELLQQGLIAPGPGTGPVEVMLYDDPGVHIFMSIDGGFFGTSDGGGGGNPRGGAGWLYDGAPFAWGNVYKRYHFVPSALAGSAGASHTVTFQLGDVQTASPLQLHEKVRVTYVEAASGSFTATAIG
jgi:hypothetical protein